MSINKQILLVEDDASLRATLRACLETEGYTCIEAKDGQSARGRLEDDSPDLIVTDHQMPKVTGLELVKGLKSQKITEANPIIFYSGQLTVDLKTHALQEGASAVLENRPHSRSSLIWLLKSVRKP